jgi:chitin disaccharide deacetylase
MITGPAAKDAVERARLLPRLRVGLHLVLVEGRPVLPTRHLPLLLDNTGRFRTDMVRLGLDIFVRPAARRQLAAEIEAQFEAFRATGIPLDHVNSHKHFHLHPTIASTIIMIGRNYGLRGLRVPIEPRSSLAEADPQAPQRSPSFAAPWARLLARSARRAGLRTPDAVFGLAWSGAMTPSRVKGLLDHLPAGRTEIYLHPATRDDFDGHAPGYHYTNELGALTSPAVKAAVWRPDVRLGGYADF